MIRPFRSFRLCRLKARANCRHLPSAIRASSDPLGKGDGLEKLPKAILKTEWDKRLSLIEAPFAGLRSVQEEEADRFFGHEAEVAELIKKFRRHRIVAIGADRADGRAASPR